MKFKKIFAEHLLKYRKKIASILLKFAIIFFLNRYNSSMNTMEWYNSLQKPFFAPPSWIFGPVWSVLYICIVFAIWFSVQGVLAGTLPKKLLIIIVTNIVSNLLFTPLQFGLKSNTLALVDICVVLLTVILWIAYVKQQQLLLWLLVPYAVWVAFATLLQLSITLLNR